VHNEFTAVFEKDGDWFIGYCPEIPGANGQGRTLEECRDSLREAIALILHDRREGGLRAAPDDAIRESRRDFRHSQRSSSCPSDHDIEAGRECRPACFRHPVE
jgi:predicted RNase H-like HicB family nuclease